MPNLNPISSSSCSRIRCRWQLQPLPRHCSNRLRPKSTLTTASRWQRLTPTQNSASCRWTTSATGPVWRTARKSSKRRSSASKKAARLTNLLLISSSTCSRSRWSNFHRKRVNRKLQLLPAEPISNRMQVLVGNRRQTTS